MTDKEQIIIDGIDVGYCKFYGSQKSCMIRTHQKCIKFPNCYFKQLARKTKECEDLKLILQQSKDNNKSTMLLLAEKK